MSGNNAQGRYLVCVQSIHRTPFGTNLKTSPHPVATFLVLSFFLFQGHMYYITQPCAMEPPNQLKSQAQKRFGQGEKSLGTRVWWKVKVVFNHNNFSYCKALGQNSQCIWRAPYRYPWICFDGGEGYYAYSLKAGGILHATCICKCKRCACKNEHSPSYTS